MPRGTQSSTAVTFHKQKCLPCMRSTAVVLVALTEPCMGVLKFSGTVAGVTATHSAMGSLARRAALKGVEGRIVDIAYQSFTPEVWAEWLGNPLQFAASLGNLTLTRALVKAGGGIGVSLNAAVRSGHDRVVHALLENGAPPSKQNSHGDAPLHIAAEKGYSEITRTLLLNGAEKDALNATGRTPLLIAAEWDHSPVVEALLNSGADLDIRFQADESDDLRTSPLDMAAGYGHLDVMRAIIDHGGRTAVKAVDPMGFTALHHAARSTEANATDAIDMLIEAGADIEAAGDIFSTPLHFSATWSSVTATHALLRHGANVNSMTSKYQTPLHWAVEYAGRSGSSATVDVLLRWGADEYLQDIFSQTPMGVLGDEVECEDFVDEEFERVATLLERATVDKAWYRRGFLVLCRVHPDRVRLARQEERSPSNDIETAAPNAHSRAKRAPTRSALVGLRRTSTTGGVIAKDGGQNGRGGGELTAVVGWVLGLDEGVFRTIVCFV